MAVLLQDAEAGEVLAQQARARDLQLELLGDTPGRRRTVEQLREQAKTLGDAEHAPGDQPYIA